MNNIVTDIPKASTNILVKNVMESLNKHYPEHVWMIKADDVGGIVNIFLPHCSLRWGHTLHIANLATDKKAVMRAGGELLERFGMKAGKLDVDARRSLSRDKLSGEVLHHE